MAERIADNPELIVDEMKRKARRRLVGAIVLALAAAIIVPMLLEKEPRPLGDDVSVQIPPVDEGRFVNRLTGKADDAKPLPKADGKASAGVAASRSEPKAEVSADAAGAAGAAGVAGAAPAAAPAPTAAANEPLAPRKSVTDAEQRVIAPSVKTVPKAEAKTAPAPKNEAKPAPKAETKVAPEPKIEAKSAPIGDAAAMPVPEPGGSAKPAAAEAKPAAGVVSQAPAAAFAAAPAKPEGFVVQLAAFADDKGANALANKLKKSGYAAYVQPVETSRGTLWRVRVGGYGSRPEAEAARMALKGDGYSGIVAPAQ
jgi:DedD protein